jgi:hypothetical protein
MESLKSRSVVFDKAWTAQYLNSLVSIMINLHDGNDTGAGSWRFRHIPAGSVVVRRDH